MIVNKCTSRRSILATGLASAAAAAFGTPNAEAAIRPKAVALYETTGETDKRRDIAGWCLEQGKGRVVGLAAGPHLTNRGSSPRSTASSTGARRTGR